MGIFHKLAVGFKRFFGGKPLNYVSSEKLYGEEAEHDAFYFIKKAFPNALIKSNIILNTIYGQCEIDLLVAYNNKVFVIEVKHWKGVIEEDGRYFLSSKADRYTNEIHQKELKSPFIQIKRQINIIKKSTNTNLWINPIVYFEGAEEVICNSDDIWFNDIPSLLDYIKNDGEASYYDQIKKCVSKLKSADLILSPSRNLYCNILDNSLKFQTSSGIVTRNDIKKINIEHHFSYDILFITLKNNSVVNSKIENGLIRVDEGNIYNNYSFSKIDKIILGD